jgi:hypothetical protein
MSLQFELLAMFVAGFGLGFVTPLNLIGRRR